MATGLNIKRNSRIFHISNECYIIYLGIKTDEDKPFIRVGNMEIIEDKILDVIANTVIPARFIGNPLYELQIDKKREINYIGDTAVIERMKTYLDSFHLPSQGAIDYHSVKDREQRDVIYFYNNGNIKLNYKEEAIFDLYKRAENDLHFVKQCDEIKKSFSRNPLRYTKYDFRGSGILLSGESLLVYNSGQFFAASLGRDYFSQLAASGIDPDQIDVHFSQIKGGDEEEEASFALIEMLKRSSFRNSPFRVHAKYPVYAKKIGALFPGAQISESGTEWSKIFNGLKVRDRGTGLEIGCEGFPLDLLIGTGSVNSEHMVLNQYTKTLSLKENKIQYDIEIPDGILCTIKDEPSSLIEMTDIYISRFVPLIKGFSTEDDYKISVAIQKLLKMLATVVDGKAKSGLIMRSSVFNFSDLLKNLELKNDSILTYFLENALTILDLSLSRSDMEGKLVRNITSIKSDIKSILIKSDKADSLLPVSADIYTRGFPSLLYRSVKSTAKKADYLLASEIADDILGEHDLSRKYYDDEKIRLFKLIDMLNSATDLEVDKMLEKHKPAEPYRERTTEVLDSRGTKSESILSGSEKAGSGKINIKTGKQKRRRALPLWLLLLFIPLLLLLLWGGFQGISYLLDRDVSTTIAQTDVKETGMNEKDGSSGEIKDTENPMVTEDSVDSDNKIDPVETSDSENNPETGETTGSQAFSGTDQITDSEGAVVGVKTDDSDSVLDAAEKSPEGESEGTVETGNSADISSTETIIGDDDIEMDNNPEKNNLKLNVKESDAETENRETQPENVVMETDDRPSTAEEAKAYLNVGDYFISAADIHLVSNRIAVDNNYRDLDFEVYDGADPDWIYPGSKISLPDKSIHDVVSGDTIWYLAAKYVRTTLDRDIPVYEQNRKAVEEGDSEARIILEELFKGSPCEEFRDKLQEVLRN